MQNVLHKNLFICLKRLQKRSSFFFSLFLPSFNLVLVLSILYKVSKSNARLQYLLLHNIPINFHTFLFTPIFNLRNSKYKTNIGTFHVGACYASFFLYTQRTIFKLDNLIENIKQKNLLHECFYSKPRTFFKIS